MTLINREVNNNNEHEVRRVLERANGKAYSEALLSSDSLKGVNVLLQVGTKGGQHIPERVKSEPCTGAGPAFLLRNPMILFVLFRTFLRSSIPSSSAMQKPVMSFFVQQLLFFVLFVLRQWRASEVLHRG